MPLPSLPSPPTLFPTYLVPSLPFRRRKSSTDSAISTSSIASTDSTGSVSASPISQTFLSGHSSHLRCSRCLTDLALSTQIISKGFTGRHGRAYLVSPTTSAISADHANSALTPKAKNDALPNLPNTYTHKPVSRQLVTGAHTVSDISCAQCGSVLGWKYVAAEEDSQKYKVGKFILETKKVCRSSRWDDEDEKIEENGGVRASFGGNRGRLGQLAEEEQVEFDSQDEDECEDLFMGVWSPQAAARRRKIRQFGRGDK
ncbi:hypothetical protein H2203_005413 [Taxawa tesnikishii (nom. ined.)]|nr:hypothetical protein H2203_005413 [Dothideales sp. JES 119]